MAGVRLNVARATYLGHSPLTLSLSMLVRTLLFPRRLPKHYWAAVHTLTGASWHPRTTRTSQADPSARQYEAGRSSVASISPRNIPFSVGIPFVPSVGGSVGSALCVCVCGGRTLGDRSGRATVTCRNRRPRKDRTPAQGCFSCYALKRFFPFFPILALKRLALQNRFKAPLVPWPVCRHRGQAGAQARSVATD